MAIRDLLKDLLGRPGELAELRDALAALPAPPPPGRSVMGTEERKRCGAHLLELIERHDRRKHELERALAEGLEKHRALEARLDELRGEMADLSNSYCAERDGLTSRLWSERPACVDEILDALEEEAVGVLTNTSSAEVPADGTSFPPTVRASSARSWTGKLR